MNEMNELLASLLAKSG